MQNDYINDYNKEHYKQITIRVSPQEADEIKATATQARQSIKQLIISAVRLYAQSLTAAETAPREISPETPTGAKKTPTEMETETPEEDQQSKPQDSPQDAHSKPQDASKQDETSITSKASATPPEDAQNATEANTSPSPEEIAEEIKTAYLKGYKQARQEIKAAQQAAQQAQRIRRTAQRTRVLTQARRRPKAYKG